MQRRTRRWTKPHSLVAGEPLEHEAITATTNAHFFGLYANTPALVYEPRAEAIHCFHERVDLASVRRLTQTTAYCRLVGLENA